MAFCVLQLADVIAALVVIRLLLQFLLQEVGLLILRKRHPEMPRPFRMWLYPAAGAARHGGICLHPDFAAEFFEGDSLRGGAAVFGPAALFRARRRGAANGRGSAPGHQSRGVMLDVVTPTGGGELAASVRLAPPGARFSCPPKTAGAAGRMLNSLGSVAIWCKG